MRKLSPLVCESGLALLRHSTSVRGSWCCAKEHSAACCRATTNLHAAKAPVDRIQCSMNQVCGRALSDKGKILNAFNKPSKNKNKTCCSVSRFTADCKCLNHHCQIDGQHKIKRLKTRKERGQMRGGRKEASKSKSHHHRHTSTDMAHLHNRCHSSCYCPSKRDVLFPNVVPAAQEPSIITDSRLIGHQGLFNHEVKSIAIERLFSERWKLEKSGEEIHEKTNATLHLSSTSPGPSPFLTNNLLGADTDKVIPFEKRPGPTTKVHDDCLEREKKISQGSDLTPGQRPQQQADISSGSFKSVNSSKRSSSDEVIFKSWRTNPIMSEKEAQLTPTVDRENVKKLNRKVKGNVISTLKQTPKNQESAIYQTQAHGLSQSPPQLCSSHSADSFDNKHRRHDPSCVSKYVSVLAAGLCDSLQLPNLRRKSLVEESREVLLKALKERHGHQLKENLLKVQQCLSLGTNPVKEDQAQYTTKGGEDDLLPTGGFTTPFQVNSQLHFHTQKTTSFKLTRSGRFNWKSPQVHFSQEQTAERLTSPAQTSVSLLDDIFRPTHSPQFCMDLEPSGVAVSNLLFTPSAKSCWREKASASQHCEDRFYKPQRKEAVILGSFENSFMNHTRPVTKRSSESQYSDSNIQPFFPDQARLREPMHFFQDQGQVEADKYSFAPPFSAHIHHPQQHRHLQPFSRFSHPSICPPLRSHHTDMLHFPPSHMLERDPAPALSSFPSPEHWSFPPMRLY